MCPQVFDIAELGAAFPPGAALRTRLQELAMCAHQRNDTDARGTDDVVFSKLRNFPREVSAPSGICSHQAYQAQYCMLH